MKILKRSGLLPAILLFFACNTGQHPALEAVHENLRYAQEENIDAYLNTLHEENPSLSDTRQILQQVFALFDLEYTMTSTEITSETDTMVVVKFVQETRKIKGDEEFRDNRVTGSHTLKKSGDAWKIFDTQMDDIEYLDEAKEETEE